MNPRRLNDAIEEPVTLDEAKAHLKIDHTDDDGYLAALITRARQHLEQELGLAFVEQTWVWFLNRWPDSIADTDTTDKTTGAGTRFVSLPRIPVLSVTSVTTFDADDTPAVWVSDNYYASTAEGRLYCRSGNSWPRPGRSAEGIEIVFKAGFGASADDVPADLKECLLQLVTHLYLNREPVRPEGRYMAVPISLLNLAAPWRKRRLV